MTPSESPSVSVYRCGQECVGSDPLHTVIGVRGGHDAATREQLSLILAQAEALDGADIIVDLSGVTFMDASTIGAFVVARNRLRCLSRSLSFRDPSPSAWRVLDLCRLAQLVHEDLAPTQTPGATALGSWVDVPTRDRNQDSEQPSVDQQTPSQAPARHTVQRCVASAESVQPGQPLW